MLLKCYEGSEKRTSYERNNRSLIWCYKNVKKGQKNGHHKRNIRTLIGFYEKDKKGKKKRTS